MAVQITRRRMRSGGACSAALSALALTGGFAGAEVAPVGLAVELGVSAVFVSAWSAIGNYVNLVLGKQYKIYTPIKQMVISPQGFSVKPICGDLGAGNRVSHGIALGIPEAGIRFK